MQETNETNKEQSSQDPIKIYANEFDEVSYKSLSLNEKQKVLSELLFQSALKNIANFRIVTFIQSLPSYHHFLNLLTFISHLLKLELDVSQKIQERNPNGFPNRSISNERYEVYIYYKWILSQFSRV